MLQSKKNLDDLYSAINSTISKHNLKEVDEPILSDLIVKIKKLGLEL